MDSIFTKIIKRELPAEIIYEDEHTVVIPDRFPSMSGQLVIFTKRQVPYIFALPNNEYQALMETTKRITNALDSISGKERTCVVIEGFEVPHVHVRLYPCNHPGIKLHPKLEASDAELKELADKVRAALS